MFSFVLNFFSTTNIKHNIDDNSTYHFIGALIIGAGLLEAFFRYNYKESFFLNMFSKNEPAIQPPSSPPPVLMRRRKSSSVQRAKGGDYCD